MRWATGKPRQVAKSTDAGTYNTVLPRHREVAAGTLRSILRQAGLSAEEWESL